MKYQQPYGVSDPEAPYINGNPSTGTMGSIPPAASIEHPQREVVNFIKDSTLVPDPADLRQLSKSVQSGAVNYSQDQGTVNFVAITPVPPISAYQIGQFFRIKMGFTNSGPTQLNVSGLGWLPVVHGDGSPLSAFEINAEQMIEVAYDGAGRWQMMTGGNTGAILMTAPRHFYINSTIGSDTAYDGTTAAISGVHGPFKTLKKALQTMVTYNLGGYDFNIYVADGIYTATTIVELPVPNGSGHVNIIGNVNQPDAVKFINTGVGSVLSAAGGWYNVHGIYVENTVAGAGDGGNALWSSGATVLWCANIAFGKVTGACFNCGPGGFLGVHSAIRLYGNVGYVFAAGANGIIAFPPTLPTLTIMNPITVAAAFTVCTGGGYASSVFSSITYNPGASVTGQRYSASGNGVIGAGGNGPNYLPGTIAGQTATGGQYL